MTGEKARFTSDRRVPSSSTWTSDSDWVAGVAEDVDVVDGRLVGRPPNQYSELPGGVASDIDDFEHEDMSIYTVENGDGSGLNADQNSPVLVNGVSAKYRSGSEFLIAYNTPTDGDLPNYPSDGDTFGIYVNDGSTGNDVSVNPGLCWAINSNGGYFAGISPNNGVIALYRYDGGGSASQLETSSVSQSIDTWYWLEIAWDSTASNRFSIRLKNVDQSTGEIDDNTILAEATTSDTTYANDGVGLASTSSGTEGRFDLIGMR